MRNLRAIISPCCVFLGDVVITLAIVHPFTRTHVGVRNAIVSKIEFKNEEILLFTSCILIYYF